MKNNYLGIDIGSVAISTALIDGQNRILHTAYTFHKGQITESLVKLLGEIELNSVKAIGYTSSGPSIISIAEALLTQGLPT